MPLGRQRQRGGEPAEVPASRHRADEDGIVEGMILHPHPVAENRSAGQRRRGVDSEHGNGHVEALADVRQQAARERRLSRAGGAGEPDRVRVPGSLERQSGKFATLAAASFSGGEQAGESAPVTRDGGFEQTLGIGAPVAVAHGVETRSMSAPIERRRPARSS